MVTFCEQLSASTQSMSVFAFLLALHLSFSDLKHFCMQITKIGFLLLIKIYWVDITLV